MKSRIYFHIDEVARDSVVASALKKEMRKDNIEVVYGNRETSSQLTNFREFDLYIFPSIDLFQSFCKAPQSLTAPIIILPSEMIGYNLTRMATKFLGSFPEQSMQWSSIVSAFCLWGPSHLRVFDELQPSWISKAHVVGSPRLAAQCCKPCMQSDGLSSLKRKPTIGFITRFSLFNDFRGRDLFTQAFESRRNYYDDGRVSPRFSGTEDKDVEDIFYREALDLRIMFDLLVALSKKDVSITIRVHPRENRLTWINLSKKIHPKITVSTWDQPFQHWLSGVTHVVGPTSTSFYDCIVSGLKPICTNALVSNRENHHVGTGDDDNPLLEFVHMPKSTEELFRLIFNEPAHNFDPMYIPKLLDILHQDTNYPDAYKSISQTRLVCLDLIEKCKKQNKTSIISCYKFNFRVQLRLFVIYIFGRIYRVLSFLPSSKRFLPEQSSTFLLTRSRKWWIDSLT